jgi:hypothetical protein
MCQIIITHDSDLNMFPALKKFLHSFFGEKIPDGIRLEDNAQNALLSIKSVERPLLICSGKTMIGGSELMADDFAKRIKEQNPDAAVVAYSTSSLHKDSTYLDAYVSRGLTPDLIEKTKAWRIDSDCKSYLHDFRLAEFAHGVFYSRNKNLESLFLEEDKIFIKDHAYA